MLVLHLGLSLRVASQVERHITVFSTQRGACRSEMIVVIMTTMIEVYFAQNEGNAHGLITRKSDLKV